MFFTPKVHQFFFIYVSIHSSFCLPIFKTPIFLQLILFHVSDVQFLAATKQI